MSTSRVGRYAEWRDWIMTGQHFLYHRRSILRCALAGPISKLLLVPLHYRCVGTDQNCKYQTTIRVGVLEEAFYHAAF